MKTVDEVYDKVIEVHESVLAVQADVLSVKATALDLRAHVNDEITLIRTSIAAKQDKTSLLTSILFQLLTHRGVRWGLGAITVSIAGTVGAAHWVPWVEHVVNLFR